MSPLPHGAREHTRVLVLEDELNFRQVLVELLADEGFDVSTCESYGALRQAIDADGGPIVLADFWGTSHTELSPHERDEIRELGRTTATVLLTGRAWVANTDPDDLNVVCLLAKPADVDHILEQIRRCLSLTGSRLPVSDRALENSPSVS